MTRVIRAVPHSYSQARLSGPNIAGNVDRAKHEDVMTAIDANSIATPSVDTEARKALAASAIGYAMDGFDLLILGFMLRAISAELHLTPPQAGSLVTWTLIGAVVGGILFGILSDYYGRVRVLTWTILLFAIFTGLCALAQGYWDLLAYRTIAGLGLGGEFGIGMALVAEAWPAQLRARACAYVALGWQAGVLVAALVTPLLLPLVGWRGMFLVGLVPGVIAFAVRWYVGEPKIFLEHAARARAKVPLGLLVKDAATARISLAMLILCAVQNFGYYGLMIWLPSYLSSRFGYTLTQSALWTAATVLGMAAGIWVFGQFADRVGRRPALLTFQAGAFVMVLVYSQLTGPTALLVGGVVMGVFVNGMLGGYGALMAELYPTEARATAENVLFNLGRGVGGFGPLVVGALVATYSFTVAIALLAVIYLIDIVATFFLIPERRGEALH
jgi:MFS family permease